MANPSHGHRNFEYPKNDIIKIYFQHGEDMQYIINACISYLGEWLSDVWN